MCGVFSFCKKSIKSFKKDLTKDEKCAAEFICHKSKQINSALVIRSIPILIARRKHMNKSKFVKNTLFNCIDSISENKSRYCVDSNTNFTRNRKLPFKTVVKTVLSLSNKSLNNEIIELFLSKRDLVSTSAFVQQRSKINYTAFYDLFRMFTEKASKPKLYKGYRLIAVDGSDIHIPTNKEDSGSYYQGANGQAPYNLLHLNALYDICSQTYVDAIVQKNRKVNERSALIQMLKRNSFDSNTIIIADRGYEAYNNFANIQELGLKYVFRIKDIHGNGVSSALDLPDEEFDIPIDLNITRKNSNKIKELLNDKRHYKYLPPNANFDFLPSKSSYTAPATFYNLKFRIVRFKLSDNTYETIATNLDMPVEEIKQLYSMRWGIETSFRTLKYTIGLLYFHSKKTELILQEIFANIIIYNFTLLIAATPIKKDKRKHTYQVNISAAVNICRQFLLNRITPQKCEASIHRYVSPIRNNRSFKRSLHSKPAFSFTYRLA